MPLEDAQIHTVLKGLFLIAYLTIGTCTYAEKAPDSIASLIPKLEAWGFNADLLQIVREHNKTNISL
ncbi:MAG: flavorubredoxin [Oceanicoccus sp.]|jgi:flavorubredoxin